LEAQAAASMGGWDGTIRPPGAYGIGYRGSFKLREARQMTMRTKRIWAPARGVAAVLGILLTGAGLLLMAGCHVDEQKNGDSDKVRIETPFGGLQVKTNDAAVLADIGLPAYPGAQPEKKKDKDDGSADVDLNFGSFHLGVKAASYLTPDSPDKVEAFYRGALKRYGDVIACRDGSAVGKPVRTFEGLTCDAHEGNHVQVNAHPDKHSLELKTGSERRQRIVEIGPDGSGTKFSLVALEVPGKSSSGEENDDTRQ
jgi:hypothetical protein